MEGESHSSSHQQVVAMQISELEGNLVYIVSSRISRAIPRNCLTPPTKQGLGEMTILVLWVGGALAVLSEYSCRQNIHRHTLLLGSGSARL